MIFVLTEERMTHLMFHIRFPLNKYILQQYLSTFKTYIPESTNIFNINTSLQYILMQKCLKDVKF